MTEQSDVPTGTQYDIPGLKQLCDRLDGFAWAGLRAATGLLLVSHGAQKLFGIFGGSGLLGTAELLEKVGCSTPGLSALLIGVTEFLGGLCLVFGLLTRPAAAAVAVFMPSAVLFHVGKGSFWTAKGYEYPLLWGIAAVFFVCKCGGARSLDGRLGREF